MTAINKTGINSSASMVAQQLAQGAPRPALSPDSSLPVAGSSSQVTLDSLNAQLGSVLNRWRDARQAIDKLGNATQEINQSKKAFAAEVIKRVKEQIRILTMMTGGDPKMRARQLASMARELAAAAREYASATGDSSPANAASTAGDGSIQNDNTVSSTGEQGNSTATAADAAAAAPSAAAVPDTSNQNSENAAPEVSPANAADATTAMQYQPNTLHQLNELLGNKISEYSQTSSVSKEDQEFVMEVRKLAAQLKALAKQNEVHSPKSAAQSTDREMADINEALEEMEKSLASIVTPDISTPSINIVAG